MILPLLLSLTKYIYSNVFHLILSLCIFSPQPICGQSSYRNLAFNSFSWQISNIDIVLKVILPYPLSRIKSILGQSSLTFFSLSHQTYPRPKVSLWSWPFPLLSPNSLLPMFSLWFLFYLYILPKSGLISGMAIHSGMGEIQKEPLESSQTGWHVMDVRGSRRLS